MTRRIKPEEWLSLIDRTVLMVAMTAIYLMARDSLGIAAHLTFWLAIIITGLLTLWRGALDRRELAR